MNKLSIVFLVIIIILVIALGISVKMYFDMANQAAFGGIQLYKAHIAIENAGLELKTLEDVTPVLIERETPVERVYD